MVNLNDFINKVICGDSLEVLKYIPDNTIDMCLTSPPYWSCRSYLKEDDINKDKELGLEDHPQEYIDKIVNISKEIMRVLKDTGNYFLNIGDVYYTQSHKGSKDNINKGFNTIVEHRINVRGKYKENWLKQKGRLLLPFRIAINLQDEGYIIRDVIIWTKKVTIYPDKTSFGSTIPYPAKDRFVSAFEYILHIVKSPKYYFNLNDVKIKTKETSLSRYRYPIVYDEENPYSKSLKGVERFRQHKKKPNENLSNWNVPIESLTDLSNPTNVIYFRKSCNKDNHFAKFPESLANFFITCGSPEGGIVLDPFVGSGTTIFESIKLNRQYIGIDINGEYIKKIEDKLKLNLF